MDIEMRYEEERGCGFRKAGGLYLVADDMWAGCGKLPMPLTVCPCCGAGIKPSRGWTWVLSNLVNSYPCSKPECVKPCSPFDGSVDKFGLLWIGEKFYPTPYEYMKESMNQGLSRRIKFVPKEFVVGETWVLLAHRKAIKDDEPGIFAAFIPKAVEYVVKDDDDEKKLESMEKRGITLVKVKPKYQQGEVRFEEEDE